MVINLARRLGDKNNEMHKGIWNKSAANCFEIRGKTLGIVGYGHIGSQLSVLAESMGMHVIFYDVVSAMPLGNSTPMPDLKSLLRKADFVSLHVPDTPQTRNMISQDELALMKKGAYLLNASRGTVVNIGDLVKALQAGHLGGAYVDVFPKEPAKASNDWHDYDELAKCSNVLLTPHIGGSTTEAQVAIGDEVAERFTKFINQGSTLGSVNFPNLDLPYSGDGTHRILSVHHNRPGVLREINNIISIYNVEGQVLRTYSNIGYLVIDVDKEASDEIRTKIEQLPASIKTRVLY
jgi:D-3-phosphoglycerate dehydrogenase / 2-oxoglutarate reductase